MTNFSQIKNHSSPAGGDVEGFRDGLCFEISSFILSSAAALLSIPGFVERLCKLATRKVSESTGTASFLQELEEWYTWLDNALVLDALMRVANEESEHSQGTWGWSPKGWGAFLWVSRTILDFFSMGN